MAMRRLLAAVLIASALLATTGVERAGAVATQCNEFTPIKIAGVAGESKIITEVASRVIKLCSFHRFSAGAQSVALIEGTRTNWGTGSSGMASGATAATGWGFMANNLSRPLQKRQQRGLCGPVWRAMTSA
jgi:hypothetical protein